MNQAILQCPVCAWRADCKKKNHFESEGGKVRCPDYTLDVKLARQQAAEGEEGRNEKPA